MERLSSGVRDKRGANRISPPTIRSFIVHSVARGPLTHRASIYDIGTAVVQQTTPTANGRAQHTHLIGAQCAASTQSTAQAHCRRVMNDAEEPSSYGCRAVLFVSILTSRCQESDGIRSFIHAERHDLFYL